MRSLLDALDDPPTLEEVLAEFRTKRERIETNMGTVEALMRPPGDPFYDGWSRFTRRSAGSCPG